MFPLDLNKLTPEQRAMVALWEGHLKAEFEDKDARASCDTMVANPYVDHVPVLTGGVGRRQLEHFYGRYFIPGQPPDVELVPISRTVGQDRIVDEFVFRCTHTVQMDWLLPGVPPTGRRLELVTVVIVTFEGGNPIFPVRSLAASLDYYVGVLGFEIDWRDATIASVSRGRFHLFLCEGDRGHPGAWV